MTDLERAALSLSTVVLSGYSDYETLIRKAESLNAAINAITAGRPTLRHDEKWLADIAAPGDDPVAVQYSPGEVVAVCREYAVHVCERLIAPTP